MGINESIDIIFDTIEEYNDARAYELYVQCVDKEQFGTYTSYKKALQEEAVNSIEIVDVEEIKAKNSQILKDFIEGR